MIWTPAATGASLPHPVRIYHHAKEVWPEDPSPQGASQEGQLSAWDESGSVGGRNGYAYHAGGWLGLGVVDCRDPAHPRPSARISLPGGAFRLRMQGSMGLVYSLGNYIHLIDFSEAGSPRWRSSVRSSGPLVGAALSGDRLYVVEWRETSQSPPLHGALNIYDVSKPDAPVLLATAGIPYPGRIVAGSSRVWVLFQDLYLFDVTDPGHVVPQATFAYQSGGSRREMLASSGVLYVSSQARDLATGALLVANYRTTQSPAVDAVFTAWTYEKRLYVVGALYREVYDISDPRAPVFLGTFTNPAPSTFSLTPSFAEDGLLYAVTQPMGIAVCDFHSQDAPFLLGYTYLPASGFSPLQLFDHGDYVYAPVPSGLVTLGRKPAGGFQVVSELPFDEIWVGSPYEGVDNPALLVLPASKPKLISLADPAHPTVLKDGLVTNSTIRFKQIEGSRVSAFTFIPVHNQLVSIDLSNPALPRLDYASYSSPYFYWDTVAISGTTVVGASATYLEQLDWPFGGVPTQRAVFGVNYMSQSVFFTTNTWCATWSYRGSQVNLYSFTNLVSPFVYHSGGSIDRDPAELRLRLANRTWVTTFPSSWPQAANAFTLDNGTNVVAPFVAGPAAPQAVIDSVERLVPSLQYLPDSPAMGSRLVTVQIELQQDRLPQSIVFKPIPDRSITDPPLALAATASSGLPVTFQVVAGPATMTPNGLVLTNSGLVTVRASQSGDAEYEPAAPVDQSFAATRPFFALSVSATNGTVVLSPNRTRVAWGDSVSLRAVPGSNFVFSAWTGTLSSTQNPLLLTVTNDVVIEAHFLADVLWADATPGGVVRKDPDRAVYAPGEAVTLAASPGRWYRFVRWDDGDTSNPRRVVVGTLLQVRAIFEPVVPLETLTLNGVTRTGPVGMPWLLLDGLPVTNDTVSVVGGTEVAFRSSFPAGTILYTLNGRAPTAFSRVFEAPFILRTSVVVRSTAFAGDPSPGVESDPVSVAVTPGFRLAEADRAGGRILSSLPPGFHPAGTMVRLEAIPDSGWRFAHWTKPLGVPQPVISVPLDHDLTPQAVFQTRLAVTPPPGGQILSQPGDEWAAYGDEVCLTAIPPAGAGFGFWNGIPRARENPLCLTVGVDVVPITATFAPLPEGFVSVSILARGGGHVQRDPEADVVRQGTQLRFTAEPDPGQAFLGWSSPESRPEPIQWSIASESETWIAEFTRNPRILDATISPGASGRRLSITLDSEPGLPLTILSSPQLSGPWTQVLGVVPLSRVQVVQLAPPADAPSSYYRVVPTTSEPH